MHTKEENIFFKKVQKHKIQDGGMFTWKFKMAAIFVKLYMSLPIHRCIDLSNQLRIYRDSIFLKLFVIPGGNALPKKIQQGDFSATLPNRSGRCQGTSPTTWLNFYTPCKSQPTSLPYYTKFIVLPPPVLLHPLKWQILQVRGEGAPRIIYATGPAQP